MKVCIHIHTHALPILLVLFCIFLSETYLGLCCLDLQFLFKKYLDYEKSQDDEERIESVKRKALEYVESTMA